MFGGGEWGSKPSIHGYRKTALWAWGGMGRRNNKIRLHGPKGGSFFFRRSTRTLVCGGEERRGRADSKEEQRKREEGNGWHSESRSVGRDGGLDFFSGEMGAGNALFLVYYKGEGRNGVCVLCCWVRSCDL